MFSNHPSVITGNQNLTAFAEAGLESSSIPAHRSAVTGKCKRLII